MTLLLNTAAQETTEPTTPLWETCVTEGLPHARHEAAFVAVGSELYLLGGRRIQPVDIFNTTTHIWFEGKSPPVETHHFQPVVLEGISAA